MTEPLAQNPEGQFEPKPSVPTSRIPAWQILFRGVALLALSALAVGGTLLASRTSGWLGLALIPITAPIALLSTWGAAVQLTGGEKFDDHPWV